jgi:hypothetical protein
LYKEVSERGAVLYFVIADLAGPHVLVFFIIKKLFNKAIRNSEKSDIVEK